MTIHATEASAFEKTASHVSYSIATAAWPVSVSDSRRWEFRSAVDKMEPKTRGGSANADAKKMLAARSLSPATSPDRKARPWMLPLPWLLNNETS